MAATSLPIPAQSIATDTIFGPVGVAPGLATFSFVFGTSQFTPGQILHVWIEYSTDGFRTIQGGYADFTGEPWVDKATGLTRTDAMLRHTFGQNPDGTQRVSASATAQVRVRVSPVNGPILLDAATLATAAVVSGSVLG